MVLKRSNTRKRNLTPREQIMQKKLVYPDYSNHTAWIMGSGPTLVDVWDWEVPKKTIVFTMNGSILWAWKHWEDNQPVNIKLKKGIHSLDDYRRPVNYWFARDNKVFTYSQIPERWYSQIAMRHPTMIKIVEHHNAVPLDTPNLYLVIIERDWQRCKNLKQPHMHKLMAGPTTLLTVLHFVYRCGFKNIVVSGIDFCRLRRGGSLHQGQEIEIRRFMDLKDIKKNHEMNEGVCVHQNKILDTAGKEVYQCGMMRNHMNASNEMIRAMQNEGRTFFKTSSRGLLHVPYIDSDRKLQAIASGKKLVYTKVSPMGDT